MVSFRLLEQFDSPFKSQGCSNREIAPQIGVGKNAGRMVLRRLGCPPNLARFLAFGDRNNCKTLILLQDAITGDS